MVSPRRRQVIIGSLAAAAAPAAFAVLPKAATSLVLSGRVLGADGHPVLGASVMSGAAQTSTDADGRFVLRTASRHYRVADIEGYVANAHADIDGTWRASFSLTL
jgi:protocatechuate 3,4-dioxygenase beta subunit